MSHLQQTYTRGLSCGEPKTIGKEYDMIFAIKHDSVDDFGNLFIFFEYNLYAEICVIEKCTNYRSHKIMSIENYVCKYDSVKILNYIYEICLDADIDNESIKILIINCSLKCLDCVMEGYNLSDDCIEEYIIGSLCSSKKLSLNQRMRIIEILSKYPNILHHIDEYGKNIVCVALENQQYDLALLLLQKYGCLLLHGNFHIKKMKSESIGYSTVDKFRKEIKPYKDELYACRTITILILLSYKYDVNSAFYCEKIPLDIIKCVLNLFYEDRIKEIKQIHAIMQPIYE